MEEYYEPIETCFDVKYSNVDVYGIISQELELLNIYMEYKKFISEHTHVIEEEYSNHTDEVIHFEKEEYNYVSMGLIIRYGNGTTSEYDTFKCSSVK